jgi:SAM-dependent methyltransferase
MVGLCIGAGDRPIDGFLNFDLFESGAVSYGRADLLPSVEDESIDLIFTNAVFEHFGTGDYDNIFSEWKRILNPNGTIVCLGIPDFDSVIQYYKSGEISLQKAHNFTTGVIEDRGDSSMNLGQVHRALFTGSVLKDIFSYYGFGYYVFNYCYPSESIPVNLGVIAFNGIAPGPMSVLESIPGISEYIQLNTINYDS